MDRLKGFIPLNFEIMSHPANWVVLLLMVYIAGLGLSLLVNPAVAEGE